MQTPARPVSLLLFALAAGCGGGIVDGPDDTVGLGGLGSLYGFGSISGGASPTGSIGHGGASGPSISGGAAGGPGITSGAGAAPANVCVTVTPAPGDTSHSATCGCGPSGGQVLAQSGDTIMTVARCDGAGFGCCCVDAGAPGTCICENPLGTGTCAQLCTTVGQSVAASCP